MSSRTESPGKKSTGPAIQKLFETLEKVCHGRPKRLVDEIVQVRSWLTHQKDKRPSGYMNHPVYFSAYSAYHLPLHLPELYWILSQTAGRLGLQAPKSVLDLGCGPGTVSLSYLLWAQSKGWAPPATLDLVDFSKKALDGARELVGSITAPEKTQVRTHKVHLHDKKALRQKADWVFMGHVLNEWGSGPRLRDSKIEFIDRVLHECVNPGGYLFIIEPPLREPTMDLMWVRDELVAAYEDNPVVAPCPGSVRYCPMLKRSLGWCYAQPPRSWADAEQLTPWDKEIRLMLEIRLENPGFTYLVLRKPTQLAEPLAGEARDEDDAEADTPRARAQARRKDPAKGTTTHAIAITDENARRGMICTNSGLKEIPVAHRGAYMDRPVKDAAAVPAATAKPKPQSPRAPQAQAPKAKKGAPVPARPKTKFLSEAELRELRPDAVRRAMKKFK